jgi:hypothetical protein
LKPLPLIIAAVCACSAAQAGSTGPFDGGAPTVPTNRIDELVSVRWKVSHVRPAALCSDAVFVRRVYLDVIGTVPTAAEAQEFLLNRNPDKRSALIDRLLQRDEFADYQAMKWCDLLRVKAEFPINLWPNAAQAYHHWIRTCLHDNVPYDKFARALLTSSGSNFQVPPVNFYRAMQNREPRGIAQIVALTFMGTRAEKWPGDQWSNLAVFFSRVGFKYTGEWKEEIIFFNPAATNPVAIAAKGTATLPDGTAVKLAADQDPRQVFADWLVDPKNPWFTRSIANRVWSWLLGRGIIQEPDDLRADNPPADPELLAALEQELVAANYDLKQLFRLILNSRTYQLSSISPEDQADAATQFAAYPLRRLDAEVLIDAVNQITGSSEKYSSAIPEPFTFVPENLRSIALPDGSISSSFLEMFGRPSRDTGLESERNNRITADQRLHLLNSSHILNKIEQSRLVRTQSQPGRTPRDIANGIYLVVLSRFPTADEVKIVETHFQSGGASRRDGVVDLTWALINSAEFLYRH